MKGEGLDAIAAEAASVLEAPAPQGDPAAPPGPTPGELDKAEAEGWAALPFMFGGMLSNAMPELRDVYSEAACFAWGSAMVPVARKHGWSLGGAGIYIALAAATWGFVGPTLEAVKKRRSVAKPDPAMPPGPAPLDEKNPPPAFRSQVTTHPDGSPIDGAPQPSDDE